MEIQIDRALRTCTQRAGITSTELGAKIGRSAQSTNLYLNGSVQPTGPTLLKLMRIVPGFAEALGYKAIKK